MNPFDGSKNKPIYCTKQAVNKRSKKYICPAKISFCSLVDKHFKEQEILTSNGSV
jgi:hypothetical protein